MTVVRKLLWPGLATLIALIILVSLGTWQLSRRTEKTAQLDALGAALTITPHVLSAAVAAELKLLPPGTAARDTREASELSRVMVTGRYLAAHSVPVRATLPSTKGAAVSGIGFFWMTPLELADGGTIVFVNRGFVTSGADFKAPAVPTPEGLQTITGLLRMTERPRAFTPADNAGKGEYFTRDPRAMAVAVGLPVVRVADFFIDAERAQGSLTPPVGVDPREMIARIPNNHLQYAVTWFAFAMTLIGVFGFFARARLKETA